MCKIASKSSVQIYTFTCGVYVAGKIQSQVESVFNLGEQTLTLAQSFTVTLSALAHTLASRDNHGSVILVSLETRLVSLETRLVSLETRLVSRETRGGKFPVSATVQYSQWCVGQLCVRVKVTL